MAKTVGQLTPEELKQYNPAHNAHKGLDPKRWQQAQDRLPLLVSLLRDRFEAKRIRLFGSLLDKTRYTQWSDIDLAAWGIPPAQFYAAVDAINQLSPDIKVDLVDPQRCGSTNLQQIIEAEGIEV